MITVYEVWFFNDRNWGDMPDFSEIVARTTDKNDAEGVVEAYKDKLRNGVLEVVPVQVSEPGDDLGIVNWGRLSRFLRR